MRKSSATVALGVVALVGWMFLVRPVDAGSGPTANKFVGTALNEITFNDGINIFSFPSIGTLHADGTMAASDGEDFLPGDLSVIDGVARGTWRMAGPNTLEGVTMYHAFDADGLIAFTGRNDFELTLVDGEEYEAAGSGVTRIYFPGTDPLDIDAGIVVGTFEMTSRRIEP